MLNEKSIFAHIWVYVIPHIWAMTSRSCIYFSWWRPGDPVFNCWLWTIDCVCWVVAEDLTGEQASNFLFERAISVLFCSSWSRNRDAQICVRTSMFFCSRFAFSQPSTPVRNATNLWTYFFQTIFMPFLRLFVLWHWLINSSLYLI